MKQLVAAVIIFFTVALLGMQPAYAKKPTPTPSPTPTATPIPTPTPTLTPTPTPILPSPTPTPTPIPPTPTPTPIPSLPTDIAVSVTAPAEVPNGGAIQYIITVTNNGPETATGVQFCSKLSLQGFTLIGLEQGPLWYLVLGGASGRYSDCSVYGELFSSLAAGSSASMSYTISEYWPQTITNTVNATALEPDLDTTNNTSTASTIVQP